MTRLASRFGITALALVISAQVGVQYAHVIKRNVALARELHSVQRDVTSLRAREIEQNREIRRLTDPRGAIPEIHGRLHLFDDKEAIIYLEHAR